mgnify:CR=1 FL=1
MLDKGETTWYNNCMKFEIHSYRKPNGREPFLEWNDGLAPAFRARIAAGLKKLEEGNFANCKTIAGGEGISEIRFNFGPGFRVYFGIAGRVIVLLLCGGDKSTQKRDIAKAREYWKEFQS